MPAKPAVAGHDRGRAVTLTPTPGSPPSSVASYRTVPLTPWPGRRPWPDRWARPRLLTGN